MTRVVPDRALFFQPLEVCIRKYFCPALTVIGIGALEIDANYLELLSQSVRKGGLVIRNPLASAAHMHETSKAATKHLVVLLVNEERAFDHNSHRITAILAGNTSRNKHLERE